MFLFCTKVRNFTTIRKNSPNLNLKTLVFATHFSDSTPPATRRPKTRLNAPENAHTRKGAYTKRRVRVKARTRKGAYAKTRVRENARTRKRAYPKTRVRSVCASQNDLRTLRSQLILGAYRTAKMCFLRAQRVFFTRMTCEP